MFKKCEVFLVLALMVCCHYYISVYIALHQHIFYYHIEYRAFRKITRFVAIIYCNFVDVFSQCGNIYCASFHCIRDVLTLKLECGSYSVGIKIL